MSKIYNISGKVIGISSGEGIRGLRIEAWDKDLLVDDFLAEATSGADGSFTMTFDPSRFQELFLDKSPDVYFKVYKGKQLLLSTEHTVMHNVGTDTTVLLKIKEGSSNPGGGSTNDTRPYMAEGVTLIAAMNPEKPKRDNTIVLQRLLIKLGHNINDIERAKGEMGQTTIEAVKAFQSASNLEPNGTLNTKTTAALNTELVHVHFTKSKPRIAKIHENLERIGASVDLEERKQRHFSASTESAIQAFAKSNKIELPNGKITEELIVKLDQEAINQRYTTKNQIGGLHKLMMRAAKMSKVDLQIEPKELKNKEFGPSTIAGIEALQQQFGLEATGKLNATILSRMESASRSKGVQKQLMGKPNSNALEPVKHGLRLNKSSNQVNQLQKILAFHGLPIAQKEFNTQTFGKTTEKAVRQFQRSLGLTVDGKVGKETQKYLNKSVEKSNPEAFKSISGSYRIKGSVRDELLERKENMVIKVYERKLDGTNSELLASRKNHSTGFFDVSYEPPIDPITGQIKENFHLDIQLYNDQDEFIQKKIKYNVASIQWINFNLADEPYQGTPLYFENLAELTKKLEGTALINISETSENRQITLLSKETKLPKETISRMVLAELVAENINHNEITPETVFAFIKQNFPPRLPGNILDATMDWEQIDTIVEDVATGLVFSEQEMIDQLIDSAIRGNLVSLSVKQNKDAILEAFEALRNTFTLEKPILVGNGSLKTILDETVIDEGNYETVSKAFIGNSGTSDQFWNELSSEGLQESEVLDLKSTFSLALLTKTHSPAISAIKSTIDDPQDDALLRTSDVAKLSVEDWESFINTKEIAVPDNIPGESESERVLNYATAMENTASRMFPAVSLIAKTKQTNHALTQISEVEAFIDEHYDNLAFKQTNLDKFVLDNNLEIDEALLSEIKMVQRIHKLAPDSLSGAALLSLSMHSAYQIYRQGKNRITRKLVGSGITVSTASRIYDRAKMQYGQVLNRVVEFNSAMNNSTPKAIQGYQYNSDAIQELIGEIPNLETLFGGMDVCDWKHCQSMYGPAAYFTDLLRFLGEHDSLIESDGDLLTVQEILLDRRPDLGNIKLNCPNTLTAMPFIDLVCEILENSMEPQQRDFSHQTTLTTEEVQAIPQYVRTFAYETLATADYPISSTFNLWQEEIRGNLNHFRLPRWELMEAFQNTAGVTPTPTNIDIAGEYFGISTHELGIITTQAATVLEQDIYWGIDTSQTSVPIRIFLNRTQLSYTQLLNLLMTQFINSDSADPDIVIERPTDTCDLSEQSVINLNKERFDLINRFLRLWRKTPWEMWELDALLNNGTIGNEEISEDTLIHLKQLEQLQNKMRLPVDVLLGFYGDLITDSRIDAADPDTTIPSVYGRHFSNSTVSDDDTNFDVPLSGIPMELNTGTGYSPIPVILAALSISQDEFDQLVGFTDGNLTLESVSTLFRYSYLADGLKVSITDLMRYLTATGVADPFASVEDTLNFAEYLNYVSESGLSALELEYILHFDEDSAMGLREETVVQYLEALRTTHETNQELIAELNLTPADLATIEAFDATTLNGLSLADAEVAVGPLQTHLSGLTINFNNASFALDQYNYIVAFEDASGFSVDTLIEMIDSLQAQLEDLYGFGAKQITALIAGFFDMGAPETEVILNNLNAPGVPDTLMEILTDQSILDTDINGDYLELNTANFPNHFNVIHLIHKISVLQENVTLNSDELDWFIDNYASVNTLDYATLPVNAAMPDANFEDWLNLYRFMDFAGRYPQPEDASLIEILDLAIDAANDKADILALIATLTQWDEERIDQMDAGFGFLHAPGTLDYANVETYDRMRKAIAQAKLTGVDIATMFIWANRDDIESQKQITLQSRHAIKSKYDSTVWLDKITPIQNELRTKKRAALVAYLLDHSQRNQSEEISPGVLNPLYWKDTNAMYKYFLIDVEMGPDQLTSRIKQAISSVQLFVQRCFLNLEQQYVQVSQDEKEDVASENAWSQWKWMKNYRIWEANRKVFFYPENWIEPELRDDKSPFFKELEQEIMQGEMNHDNAEAALLNYLSKLDDVANLEVMGTYHEFEDLNDQYEGYEIDRVHVIARTKDTPSIYFYRYYDMNYATWSAWEKIDVEIGGDHAVPVVYNRKLHIFWLIFMEKPQKVKKVPAARASSGPTSAPEAQKMLEIQLGWTVKKDNGWTPKSISKKKLIHPWERPQFSYNLKPFFKNATNELWMDLYITTSREFNDRFFYDPYENGGRYAKATHIDFNETYRPWHSSSFVFNGKVRDVKMNALSGDYRLQSASDPDDFFLSSTDSVTYVQSNFGEDGRAISKFGRFDDGPKIDLPIGMHYHNGHLTNNQHDQVNNSNLNVLVNGTTRTLLSSTINPFEVVVDHQDIPMNLLYQEHPIFYQDYQRCVFIRPEWEEIFDEYGQLTGRNRKYQASSFYHPYTTLFIRELNRDGIDGFLTRKMQIEPDEFFPGNDFRFTEYAPASDVVVHENLQKDIVDFSQNGAFALYNWELFFHIPMLIANRLTQNQRFEEAMRWYHYIFNPTNIDSNNSPQRYWLTKPFFEYNESDYQEQRIENLLTNQETEDFKNQLIAWRNDPFNPHLIARYRPVAYQKNVVMKYIDNLIAWGDQLFRRDTMESINEASLLYMLADEILGERPTIVPRLETEELTFNELPELDAMANATVEVIVEDTVLPIQITGATDGMPPLPSLETLYFGIPGNDYLDKYWDTVEDRMYKIRNSMNIDGIKRSLSLFAPPIDPALLVKAAAAGIDLSTVLNDISVGMPIYRFKVMIAKAVAFCQDVNQLGNKLLAALESKDQEALSVIRGQHEVQLLKGIKLVREIELDEAVESIGSLNQSKEMADAKSEFFGSKEYMTPAEIVEFTLKTTSAVVDTASGITTLVASALAYVPDFDVGAAGFGGTPTATVQTGGKSLSEGTEKAAKVLSIIAKVLEKAAALTEKQAKYQERAKKYKFEKEQADMESNMIQFQINAATLRQDIAEQRLTNQEEEIVRAEEVYDYMRSKYTNEQLYNWMISRISSTYFQAYQLAFEIAKKAELCYQYELGVTNTSFIQFGYWDSLKKGLLSGESLMHDLRRMEASYLDLNKREMEITKHISLAQVAPLSLINLKQNGECTLAIPEWLIDMDYPGHYMRRIKSVSISIPCVTGPYTSVNCTLSLTKHEMRITSEVGAQYEKEDEDDRFRTKYGAVNSIATSHGRNDNGMFELIFTDERYLPFEGAGLDSEWLISLPKENNQFDFNTISDVIVHINYTSRNGGSLLADAARSYTQSILPESSFKLFSLKHEFPNEWHAFLNPSNDDDQEFSIDLSAENYPFFMRSRLSSMNIEKVDWYIQSEEAGDFNILTNVMAGAYDPEPGQAVSPSGSVEGTHHWQQDVSVAGPSPIGTFGFKLQKAADGDFVSLTAEDLENLFVVFHFAD